MRTELNDRDYVAFARKFVKETVDTMDIKELKNFVVNAIHEEIEDAYVHSGQRGAFDDMQSWDGDVFDEVAKDFELVLEEV